MNRTLRTRLDRLEEPHREPSHHAISVPQGRTPDEAVEEYFGGPAPEGADVSLIAWGSLDDAGRATAGPSSVRRPVSGEIVLWGGPREPEAAA